MIELFLLALGPVSRLEPLGNLAAHEGKSYDYDCSVVQTGANSVAKIAFVAEAQTYSEEWLKYVRELELKVSDFQWGLSTARHEITRAGLIWNENAHLHVETSDSENLFVDFDGPQHGNPSGVKIFGQGRSLIAAGLCQVEVRAPSK